LFLQGEKKGPYKLNKALNVEWEDGFMSKYIILLLFVLLMVAIGIYSRKKVSSVDDFFLGGRQMGPWISAFAYGTTYFSAVIFIGYAGRTGWNFGISGVWIGIGNAVLGSFLAWKVLAKKTRVMTHDMHASTMPEFFEKRYGSKALRVVTALVIFIFLVPYSASVYQGLGYLFEIVFHVPFIYCMAAMAVLTGIYVILGGYVATALTDFFQGIIMIVGLVLMVLFVVYNPAVGGFSEGIERLSKIPNDGPALVSIFSGSPLNLFALVILTSFGTWGLPQMVHKFYAIRDEKAIKTATIVATAFAGLISCGAYFTGAFGRLFLNNTVPLGANGQPNLDLVMPQILMKALPDYMLGIIVVLVLSASMSTLSSLVLVSSSAISMDLVKGVIAPNIKNDKEMLLMRILCAVFVAFSFFVAVTPNAILTLMSFSWGTVAGAFLAPFLFGLYWKGANKYGAWAGFICGISCSVGGAIIYKMNAGVSVNIGAISMIVSLIAVPTVSKIASFFMEPEKVSEPDIAV